MNMTLKQMKDETASVRVGVMTVRNSLESI